ncbi:hypothetical protein [Dactylosporangium sp. NPDC006015]|uniref:hypothetical protein n=1 Tax=Dactylosporangium sp. NPDC006015 TaxID=3154576 RepID=UPI0033BB0FEF
MNDHDDDPFHGLDDWAKDVERRAKRAHRWGRVARLFRWSFGWSEVTKTTLWIAGAVAAAVLLAAAFPYVRAAFTSDPGGGDTGPAAYPTQPVPSGISVTTSASAAPTGPFDGTAAATYPKGDAGITMPPATAVTGFSQAEVSADLQLVHQALVAGRLDQKMLVGHDNSAFLALLAPNARTGTTKWLTGATRINAVTWIDPSTKLDPDEQPRVSGRVTFDSAKVDGVQTLRITTNFVWVYAFDVRQPTPIAAVHDSIRWEFPKPDQVRKNDRGMWIADTDSYVAWMDCAGADKGLLAPGKPAPATPHPSESEPADAILRPDHTLDIGDDCAKPPTTPKP